MYGNNQGFNNYVNGNGYNPNNYNMGQMGGFNNFNPNNKPPIPFNSNNMNRNFCVMSEIIANGQKFSGESKKVLEKLKAEHTKALESVQTLDILRYSIQSEENFLRKENVEMNNFLSANEENQST
jgi:hypothetical protein